MQDDVPEIAKKVHGEEITPEEVGPPNAESKGVWRILRNSLIAVIGIFAAILFFSSMG